MTPPSCSERLRRLFRFVTLVPSRSAGPHPVEDEELLTCWSLDLLSSAESAAFTEHLARCPACRDKVIDLIRAEVIAAPSATAVTAAPQASSVATIRRIRPVARRRLWLMRVSVAAAAAVLAAVALLWDLRGDDRKTELARAENEIKQGQRSAALSRLENLLHRPAAPLDAADAGRARQLLEQAAYGETRDALTQGRFPEAQELVQRMGRDGVQSARLENLRMQAAQAVPAEVTLAYAGDLTHYGFDLNGLAPPWKDLPIVDKATQQRDDEWKRLLAADPHSVVLLLNYGQFQYSLSRLEQARQSFTQAKAEDAASVGADLGLGLVAYEKRAYGEALNHFQAALDVDRANAPAVLNTAICLERLDRGAEARQYWVQARDLVPDGPLRKRIDERLAKTPVNPE